MSINLIRICVFAVCCLEDGCCAAVVWLTAQFSACPIHGCVQKIQEMKLSWKLTVWSADLSVWQTLLMASWCGWLVLVGTNTPFSARSIWHRTWQQHNDWLFRVTAVTNDGSSLINMSYVLSYSAKWMANSQKHHSVTNAWMFLVLINTQQTSPLFILYTQMHDVSVCWHPVLWSVMLHAILPAGLDCWIRH